MMLFIEIILYNQFGQQNKEIEKEMKEKEILIRQQKRSSALQVHKSKIIIFADRRNHQSNIDNRQIQNKKINFSLQSKKVSLKQHQKHSFRNTKQKFLSISSQIKLKDSKQGDKNQLDNINHFCSIQQPPQTDRQKFMNILQSRILNEKLQQSPKITRKTISHNFMNKKLESTRYNNFHSKTFRIEEPRPMNQSSHNQPHSDQEQEIEIVPKIQSKIIVEEQKKAICFRNRSKTLTKQLEPIKKITVDSKNAQISRTIQFNQLEQKEKLHKSIVDLQKYQHISKRQTKEIVQIAQTQNNLSKGIQEINKIEVTKKNQDFVSQMNSVIINNTQIYEEEVNILTQDFFQEWEKMNLNKNKLYKNFRKKMGKVYPNMKKHYTQADQQINEYRDSSRLQMSSANKAYEQSNQQMSPSRETNRMDKNDKPYGVSSNHSFSNQINQHQAKNIDQKMQQFNQKKVLRDIFKQAYFWSRTKNKYLSTSMHSDEQLQKRQMANLKRIQKNLTFMNYMKNKSSKSQLLHSNNKIKGFNIIKNKDSILEIQKQGSKQQEFLKKYLETAIDNCLRDSS